MDVAAQADSVTVVAGPRYDAAGGLKQRPLGAGYRELWTTPIRVKRLDLSRTGGGLRPRRSGGGRQTVTLHFDGRDGRRYVFRSVDKDLAVARPVEESGRSSRRRGGSSRR